MSKEKVNQREFLIQNTTYAFIISLVFPLFALLLEFLKRTDLPFNLKGISTIYSENPIQWIVLMLVIIVPVVVYLFLNFFYSRISEKENKIIFEQARSKKVNLFVRKLIQEDFSQNYEVSGEEDELGNTLSDLRNALKGNKEQLEKRRIEDQLRSWLAEGLAKFGDILRNNTDNMEALSYNVIRELTKYIHAIQGSIYLLNNDDPGNIYFQQTAFYAYDRRKVADQKIKWGDGLIGTAALEHKSIYMTRIPDSYVKITSGLGQTNPKSILITPLISGEEIYGVIELASLTPMKDHEINFVERVAESIGSTIATVKTNVKTSSLLEESRQHSQAISAQEEEMRQNMEELQATQEELARQADRFVKLENTVNHTMIRADYDRYGTLLYANTKFLSKLEYTSNSDVEGKNINMFIGEKDREWFDEIWKNLSKGGRHFEGYMKHVSKSGKDLWTMATYTCIRGENDEVERILFLALDTTEQKKLSLRVEGIVDAVDKSSIKIELSSNGSIIDFNENLVFALRYDEKELKNLSIFDIIDKIELENFSNKWETVVRGIGFQGVFKLWVKDGEKWLRGAFSAVYDMYGDVTRVLFIGHEITNEKKMDIELRNQTEILKKQEKLLRESEKELSRKLREARMEMQNQFKEIERIKIRNERTLEGALDAILTTSHDNKIIFFNKAAEELWGYSREEVMGQDIGVLFSNQAIEEDDFLLKFTGPGDEKIIGVRKEIKIFTKNKEEKPVLILLSKAQVDQENTYTAFIQNIEVELF